MAPDLKTLNRRHEKQLDWLCVTDGQTCI